MIELAPRMAHIPHVDSPREAGFNQQVYVIADFVCAVTIDLWLSRHCPDWGIVDRQHYLPH